MQDSVSIAAAISLKNNRFERCSIRNHRLRVKQKDDVVFGKFY